MSVHDRSIVLIACSHTAFAFRGSDCNYYHAVPDSYVDAAISALDCTPLLLPAVSRNAKVLGECIRLAHGALFTGDPSNIAPETYGGTLPEDPANRDQLRDETVLPFVRAAIADGLPIFGICRGVQEINVALGGTLYQRVHEVPGRLDHRAPRDRTLEESFSPAHRLIVRKGGWLETVLSRRAIASDNLRVNSLHGQAIDKLGRSVVVEATAEDGTVEAIRVANTRALTIGVQWHPEWHIKETPLHSAIFDEFRRACLKRLLERSASRLSVSRRRSRR